MTEREGSESRKQRRRENEKREKVRGGGSSYLDPDLPLSPPCLLDSEVRTAVHLQRVRQFHSTDEVRPKQLQGKHVHRSEKAPTQLYQGSSIPAPFHTSRTVFPTAATSSFLRHSSRLTPALPHTLQTTQRYNATPQATAGTRGTPPAPPGVPSPAVLLPQKERSQEAAACEPWFPPPLLLFSRAERPYEER